MSYLTRDQILEANDIPQEEVDVPEWGGTVLVRGLTGEERDDFEGEVVQMRGKETRMNLKNFRAKLVARTIVNEEGERIFSDSDVKALGKKSGLALQRVFEIAQRLSGLSDQDVEELVKN